MAIDLVDLVERYPPGVIQKATTHVGESSSAIQKGLAGIVPIRRQPGRSSQLTFNGRQRR